ncbi:hypothetical protein ABL78_7936 [Leptomonas seymouri]|uniref:Uncharacterized protein n=1 Tax=Leptomonas seymouri TaxID=5684 RepID=A0A0N1HZU8_LEPSE|nr:hypothetical protein ABL78_7936 [Leptomonas seymouri]|eukprot:KPI83044.1 hypothetical protein ABL78_7936 [Leptomonas seymouri]
MPSPAPVHRDAEGSQRGILAAPVACEQAAHVAATAVGHTTRAVLLSGACASAGSSSGTFRGPEISVWMKKVGFPLLAILFRSQRMPFIEWSGDNDFHRPATSVQPNKGSIAVAKMCLELPLAGTDALRVIQQNVDALYLHPGAPPEALEKLHVRLEALLHCELLSSRRAGMASEGVGMGGGF